MYAAAVLPERFTLSRVADLRYTADVFCVEHSKIARASPERCSRMFARMFSRGIFFPYGVPDVRVSRHFLSIVSQTQLVFFFEDLPRARVSLNVHDARASPHACVTRPPPTAFLSHLLLVTALLISRTAPGPPPAPRSAPRWACSGPPSGISRPSMASSCRDRPCRRSSPSRLVQTPLSHKYLYNRCMLPVSRGMWYYILDTHYTRRWWRWWS